MGSENPFFDLLHKPRRERFAPAEVCFEDLGSLHVNRGFEHASTYFFFLSDEIINQTDPRDNDNGNSNGPHKEADCISTI